MPVSSGSQPKIGYTLALAHISCGGNDMIFKIAVSIFLLLNSIGTLPIFIALTNGCNFRQRCRIAAEAASVAMAVLLAFIWTGDSLMEFFGLSVPAFEIGGGIILFRIGMEMLNCSVDLEKVLRHIPESITQKTNSIVPLGIPLLAGPGCIAVIMTITVGRMYDITPAGVSAALASAMLASMFIWLGGSHLFSKINLKSLSELLTRLGGLFLVVLSVQMIINGYQVVRG